jgi:hypothetical protein
MGGAGRLVFGRSLSPSTGGYRPKADAQRWGLNDVSAPIRSLRKLSASERFWNIKVKVPSVSKQQGGDSISSKTIFTDVLQLNLNYVVTGSSGLTFLPF